MKIIAVLLIALGIIGIILGGMMFGDIAIAAWIASLTSLLSGIGFWQVQKTHNR